MKRRQANALRIIGGTWRSRVLRFADAPGLRPSPDRVRETLFNWLGQDLTGLSCLDLFAGSGALGFEAASRGAREVVLVERAKEALLALRDNTALLEAKNMRVIAGDALEFLSIARDKFDVVFLDPPYGSGLLERALTALPKVLAPEARIYAENDSPLVDLDGWLVLKQGKAGAVHYHLMQRVST